MSYELNLYVFPDGGDDSWKKNSRWRTLGFVTVMRSGVINATWEVEVWEGGGEGGEEN